MNQEQRKIHGEVIKWWINNPDKGVLCKESNDTWFESNEPSFCANFKYVQDDEYAEYRKAQVDGKQIQYRPPKPHRTTEEWFNTTINKGSFIPNNEYRIKPYEPQFKVGDWVRDTVNHKTIQLSKHYHEGGIELWKPKKGEWCVFWDNGGNYIVAMFGAPVNMSNQFHVAFDSDWDNIAPKAFTATLKET